MRTWIRKLQATAFALIAALAVARAEDRAGVFDYYVLALSWSPTYCASDAGLGDRHQCGTERRFAFVVHGLWPQYEDGWPDHCDTDARFVPDALIDAMLDIMPSRRLVIHEWRKHGTCSGLGQAGYFETTRDLFAAVRIPARYITPTRPVTTTAEEIERDFIATNPWLDASMISVHCGNRRDRAPLEEVRLCFGRDLEPRPCGANERRACRADSIVLPPVR